MGRFLFPILFVVVLLSPFLLRLAVGRDEGRNIDAEARLVVVTPHNRDITRAFAAAFADWHRENHGYAVELDYRSVGGTGDIVKAMADFYGSIRDDDGDLPPIDQVRGAPFDVVWGGGDFVFNVELESIGALQAVELPDDLLEAAYPQPELGGIALYDQDDDGIHWYGVCLSSFGLVYSPYLYEQLDLPPPATWSDLADPKLYDLLVLADPSKSGSAAVAYIMALQRAMADAEEAFLAAGGEKDSPAYDAALEAGWKKGQGDLLMIAANARYFTDGAQAVPADVSHANAAAGTAIDFYGRVEEETVGSHRIRYVVPKAATAVTPDPVAVAYGTTGDELVHAQRFIEFLLSPRGQLLWNLKPGVDGGPGDRALRRTPIRRDVFAGDRSAWTDRQNPFEEAADFNQRQEWMGEFSETRALWQAAWIHAGESLDRAVRAILDVENPDRQAELFDALRDLPVEWADPETGETRTGWSAVRALRADRKSQPREAQAIFLSTARVELANRFRAHYDRIRELADE
jgi:ABC-type Fe3+ transport system substrate-binding protein